MQTREKEGGFSRRLSSESVTLSSTLSRSQFVDYPSDVRKLFLISILWPLLFLGIPALADERSDHIRKEILRYSAQQKRHGPAGLLDPLVENLYFALFVLKSPTPPIGGEIQLSEWGDIIQALMREGFKFSLKDPPFGKDQGLQKILFAKKEGKVSIIEGLYREFSMELIKTRLSFPIPVVKIPLRGSLTQSLLPPTIKPLPMDHATPITLNQAVGNLDRLAEVFEIVSQTEIGRKTLGEFLPALKRGDVSIAPLDDSVKQKHPELFQGQNQAAALFVIDLEENKGAFQLKGVLYLDPKSETGILAECFMHESLHAIDPTLRDTRKSAMLLIKQSRELREKGQIKEADTVLALVKKLVHGDHRRTEEFAHEGQELFKRQLESQFEGVAPYFHAHIQRGSSVGGLTPERYQDAYAHRLNSLMHHSPCQAILRAQQHLSAQ